MANNVQFLGFKRVSQSVFNAVPVAKKEQYLWFVKPDGDNINETGDIYLGTFHYGHYGHADADNIQALWDALGELFSSGSSVTVSEYIESIQNTIGTGFTPDNTVTDVINALEAKHDEDIQEIKDELGEGFSGMTYTEKINEVDNEWRRVVGDGFVDDAIVVDGERFFEHETVSNVVCANTIALLIEIDEPINVTEEELDDMADNNSAATGLSTLLGDYSDVTLPEGTGDVDLESNIVVGGTGN